MASELPPFALFSITHIPLYINRTYLSLCTCVSPPFEVQMEHFTLLVLYFISIVSWMWWLFLISPVFAPYFVRSQRGSLMKYLNNLISNTNFAKFKISSKIIPLFDWMISYGLRGKTAPNLIFSCISFSLTRLILARKFF